MKKSSPDQAYALAMIVLAGIGLIGLAVSLFLPHGAAPEAVGSG